MKLNKLLAIIALICFVLAAFGVAFPPNAVAFGLAFWVLSQLV